MTSLEELTFGGLLGDYTYGAPDDRVPPRKTTLFKVNPAKPGGLEAVKVNFATEPAEKFEFEAA